MADGDGVGGWARDLVGYAHLGGLGWGLVGVPADRVDVQGLSGRDWPPRS